MLIAALVGAQLVTGCNIQFRNKHYRPKPKPDNRADYWAKPRDVKIGQVTLVDQSGFVLITNARNLALPVGQKLHIDGGGGRSTVNVSTERSQTHLAADIAAGSPQVGDLVVYRHRPGLEPSDGEAATLRTARLKSEPLDLEEPLPPLP